MGSYCYTGSNSDMGGVGSLLPCCENVGIGWMICEYSCTVFDLLSAIIAKSPAPLSFEKIKGIKKIKTNRYHTGIYWCLTKANLSTVGG